jgi:hypothetical protein
MLQLHQQNCFHFRELWPTIDEIVNPYIFARYKTIMEFNSFGIQNDIVLDFLSIPLVIQKHIRKLTTNIEEMLLSTVISIMSVFRLPTGGNVSPGYVANFKQDIAGFIREIPLTASQLPCLVKEEALLELDDAKKRMEAEEVERKLSKDFLDCKSDKGRKIEKLGPLPCGQHLCRIQSLPKTHRRCWPILIQHQL